jgi:glycosyltransferase involved in cell wall biosynthesis
MKPIRVLLIAEAANPEWVSVPLVGWCQAEALARRTEAHLVTQVRNRDAIVRAGWTEGREFTAIDSERLAAPLWKLASVCRGGAGRGWTTLTALASMSYFYFERLIWKKFGPDICAGRFDVVHRLTPLSPTTPSPLACKCHGVGVPFVLGPLNGGVAWPRGFDYARRYEREWFSYVRGAYKLLPGYRRTRACAAALVIGSRATLAQVPACYRHKCVYVPENAIDPRRFPSPRTRQSSLPLRVVFVGRLVPYKGPDMLLEAAAPLVRQNRVALDFIGEGPLRPQLAAMIASSQLESGVRLCGWVDHTQLQHHLGQADILGLPSIREFGGAVVLEAMALGVVPLVVNYGGPAELVTPQSGFLIELGSRRQIVEAFRAVLERLCQNPALLAARSLAATRRVDRLFTWDRKAEQMMAVYRWVLGQRTVRPDFGMPLAEPDFGAETDAKVTSLAAFDGHGLWEPVS